MDLIGRGIYLSFKINTFPQLSVSIGIILVIENERIV